ncbi:cell surface glycoprotein (s-layer protein)-like protein [Anaeramoeba flamelloides]|uniref:Cell surface glycoprotein (S-layer protein)-like protein n=1 Tax=Anaeramoeba flamelloides TaxID=1746091 RepID=A0AAV7Y4I3_9EUKA|nr:cell surface glycoprotein (s-layer protein)-like protein [Anaeramoeba flamelloides]
MKKRKSKNISILFSVFFLILVIYLQQKKSENHFETKRRKSTFLPTVLFKKPKFDPHQPAEYHCVMFPGLHFDFSDQGVSVAAGSNGDKIRINYPNANLGNYEGKNKQKSYTNFIRSDKIYSHLENYESLVYHSIYPGIDLEYTVTETGLKSNYHLQKAQFLESLVIEYQASPGIESVVTNEGSLEFYDQEKNLVLKESPPILIQNTRQFMGTFVLKDTERRLLGFQLKHGTESHLINKDQPLIIDPNFSSLYGGNNQEEGKCIAVDENKMMYLGGETESYDLPTTDGAYSETKKGSQDLFLLKLDSTQNLVWSTFIGSAGKDIISGLQLDTSANPIVTGSTNSSYKGTDSFPTMPGAFRTECSSTEEIPFVTKLSTNGDSLVFSTFLCPETSAEATALYVAPNDNIYILGDTFGKIEDCTTPTTNTHDIYVAELTSDGTAMTNIKCFGGDGDDSACSLNDCIQYQNGKLYFAGSTNSTNFPVTPGAFQEEINGSKDCFLIKFDLSDFLIEKCTLYGGEDFDFVSSIHLDTHTDTLWFSGSTVSAYLPVTENAYQTEFSDDGILDGYFANINLDLDTLLYGSYLGVSGEDERVTTLRTNDRNEIMISGMANPFNDFDYNYDYGRGTFVMILNLDNNEVVKKNTYGALNLLGTEVGDSLYEIYGVGDSTTTYKLYTTPNALKDEIGNNDQDVLIFYINMNCSRGEYGTMDGCEKCPGGTMQPNFGVENSDSCTECGHGKYSPEGSSVCYECQPGSYGPLTRLENCFECPKGTWSDATGATSESVCEKCPAGKYLNAMGGSSLDSCQNCKAGYYSTIEGSISEGNCLPCPQGTYSNVEAIDSLDDCLPCPQGTYSNETNLSEISQCTKCPKGSYSDRTGAIGVDFCLTCPTGTHNPNFGGDSIDSCIACETGTVSLPNDTTQCYECGIGLESNSDLTECIKCSAGYYSDTVGENCEKCKVDSFNDHEGASYCTKCLIPDQCLGGNECNDGHSLEDDCKTCIDGYFLMSNKCVECPNTATQIILMICVISVFLLLLIFKKYLLKLDQKTRTPIKYILFNFFQLLAAIFSLSLPITKLVGDHQLWLSVFLFQFRNFFTLECLENFGFFESWLIMFLLPIIVSFFALGLYLSYFKRFKNNNDKLESKKASLIYWYTFFLNIIYLPYGYLSVQPFNFTYFEKSKKWVLNEDPNYSIDSKKYKSYLPAFYISCVLYVLCIPIYFTILLIKAKRADFNDHYNNRFGWFYQWYDPNKYWFEFVNLFSKIAIVLSLVLFDVHSDYQILYLMIIFFTVLLFIIIIHPYWSLDGKKYASGDTTSIGTFLILFSITSIGISKFSNLVFIFVWPIGIIFIIFGLQNNWHWFKGQKSNNKKNSNNNTDDSSSNDTDSSSSKNLPPIPENMDTLPDELPPIDENNDVTILPQIDED